MELIIKGDPNLNETFCKKLFNEIIPKTRYKDTKFSIVKSPWYINSPWIIYYQVDENRLIEISGHYTKKACVEFLNSPKCVDNIINECNSQIKYHQDNINICKLLLDNLK